MKDEAIEWKQKSLNTLSASTNQSISIKMRVILAAINYYFLAVVVVADLSKGYHFIYFKILCCILCRIELNAHNNLKHFTELQHICHSYVQTAEEQKQNIEAYYVNNIILISFCIHV
jgi:hypothetical protein